MSNTERAARWALEDEELEALMSGATPEDLGRIGNPVAEFFVDARAARGVRPPSPDESLRQIFAGEGQLFGSRGAPQTPLAVAPPTPGYGLDEPTRPNPVSVDPVSSRLVDPGPVRPEPRHDLFANVPDVAPIAGAHDAPRLDPSFHDATRLATPGYDTDFADQRPRSGLLAEHTAAHNRVVIAHDEVYDSSPTEFLAQVLRPNAPKVLMGLAVVALFFTVGQLLGVINLPLLGSDGDANVAAGDLAGSDAGLVGAEPGAEIDGLAGGSAAPADGTPGLVTVPLPSTVLVAPESTIPTTTVPLNTTTPTIVLDTTSTVVETTVSTETTLDPALTTTTIEPGSSSTSEGETTTTDDGGSTTTSEGETTTTDDGGTTTTSEAETTTTVADVEPTTATP